MKPETLVKIQQLLGRHADNAIEEIFSLTHAKGEVYVVFKHKSGKKITAGATYA